MGPEEIAAAQPGARARRHRRRRRSAPPTGSSGPLRILEGYLAAAERLGVRVDWGAEVTGFGGGRTAPDRRGATTRATDRRRRRGERGGRLGRVGGRLGRRRRFRWRRSAARSPPPMPCDLLPADHADDHLRRRRLSPAGARRPGAAALAHARRPRPAVRRRAWIRHGSRRSSAMAHRAGAGAARRRHRPRRRAGAGSTRCRPTSTPSSARRPGAAICSWSTARRVTASCTRRRWASCSRRSSADGAATTLDVHAAPAERGSPRASPTRCRGCCRCAALSRPRLLLARARRRPAPPCASSVAGGRSSTTGPDAVALPVDDRYRYGVVLGSVMTASGRAGLQRRGLAPADRRAGAGRPLHRTARGCRTCSASPSCFRAGTSWGCGASGFMPVRQQVEVRIGQVVRAVVTMAPTPG